ncbi:GspE/PulE family protein [Fusobacterium polymorphum]|uniref:GspE/PulE family protein n=1 Tax=Fusobacterium nucleatum subsp. polymorphum TaxID=76857 RepID=UPI0030CACAD5
MGNSSEKIEKYFKKTINSTMNNNKNSYIEDIEELFIRENVNSNKGIFSILLEAIKFSASDIHIEALTDKIRIRYRINGILKEVAEIDKSFLSSIVSKLKILSSLDIVEKRKPQDGRFSLKYKGREIDFRTSIIPTMNGEKIVIRILDKFNYNFTLEDLYLSEENKRIFYKAINQNTGIILVNGPTGSGKSSTLYSILKYKNREEVNISTVEDPIEYQIEGINQIQCRNEIGLDFVTILRALLRQDPDILMVGEIRDRETAEIAVKASLTGHLVFSTLHSNDSLGCINRLVNLGIDSYLLSLVLQMVVSQRLVRKLCPHCKKEDENYKEKLKSLNLSEEKYKNVKFYTSVGCEKCMETGYIGRIPVFEIIYFDDILKDMLAQKKEIKQNFKTLLDDAMDKAKEGLTSLDEIMRQL